MGRSGTRHAGPAARHAGIPTIIATNRQARSMTLPQFHVRRFLLATACVVLAASGASASSGNTEFIVTSADTFTSSPLRHLPAKDARDSLGTALKLLEVDATQRALLTDHVHENEHRCGGYFAFDSQKDAEDFLARERSLQSLLAAPRAAYSIDNHDTVAPWLPQVAEANIRATITHLSSYQNRYFSSPHGQASAEWIGDTWLALGQGRKDVHLQLFTECTNCSTQPSVILTVQGNEIPDEVIVVGAHLDSIRSGGGGLPEQFAPGADDDASGIAVITEIIRIALSSDWKPKRTIKFMGYAAEEVGLRGSNAIAQKFATDGVDVVGVLQLDMTNYHVSVPYHFHFIADFTNPALLAFSKDLFDTYLAPLNYVRQDLLCNYACSDHASWTASGFPAVMASEPGSPTNKFFPGLHTANDTLAQVGGTANASVPFAYFGLAFIGELAKTSSSNFSDGFEAPSPPEK